MKKLKNKNENDGKTTGDDEKINIFSKNGEKTVGKRWLNKK